MVIRQLSVFVENRPGRLSEVIGVLGKNNINLRAISIAEASDYGVLRLIVDHTDAAAEILRGEGCVFSVTPVVAAAIPDEVGGLNKLLNILSQESIDIEYMYSVFGKSDGLAYMVFKVSDSTHLEQVLEAAGIHSSGKRELGQ